MLIVLFGASGRTGRRVAELARAAGHEVRAVSRSAPTASESTEVEWVQADIRDDGAVRRATSGADAVISTVGIGSGRKETTIYSAGVRAIAQTMTDSRTKRLAVVSAAPVGDAGDLPLAQRAMRQGLWWLFGATYRDMTRMEDELARWPHLSWVCLRPPYLRDAPPTGRFVIDPVRPSGNSIATGDLATALLDAVTGPVPDWQTAYIATAPHATKGRSA